MSINTTNKNILGIFFSISTQTVSKSFVHESKSGLELEVRDFLMYRPTPSF